MSGLALALRWLGLRGAVALLALILVGVQHLALKRAASRLALSEARVAVLEAQRDAAEELAADYRSRAERAVADKILADQAAAQAAKVRARKWDRIKDAEKAWAEVPVPDAVVEGLR